MESEDAPKTTTTEGDDKQTEEVVTSSPQQRQERENTETEVTVPTEEREESEAGRRTTESESAAAESPIETYEDEVSEEEEFNIDISTRPHKIPFKLKQNENGNILTVHHTVNENDKIIRIRMSVCCFNERVTQFVCIDRRGNVFVFDLVSKRYWRLSQPLLKSSTIRSSIKRPNQYFVGTKLGELLLLDAEKCQVLKSLALSKSIIVQISFPGQPLQPSNLALVHAGHEAVLVNLKSFKATHRLDFDEVRISLKFASYLPYSEQIFTCFTNDAVQVWSGVTLNTLRVANPIKARDRKLRIMDVECIPQFSLSTACPSSEFELNCHDQDYSNGLIIAYCYPPNGNVLCLTTLDNYLLLLNPLTLALQSIFRLRDFALRKCVFLPKPREMLIVGITMLGQAVLLDCQNTEFKMIIQSANACDLSISNNGKLLAVLSATGEVDIWSTCQLYNTLKSQEQCVQMLRAAFKQSKPITLGTTNECFNEDLKKLLKPERLLSILKEYGCYPAKYRNLIWSSLLRVPYNSREYQLLLKMGTPAAVKQRAAKLKLKNETVKRALIKVWSCLAWWCKVFAYSDFLPYLIFPFVQLFSKNTFVCFEICVTLLLNHFQLWFEFHPLEPANYLGMCENVLQHFDAELCKFYTDMQVKPVDYAWSMLSSSFSEVLDEVQWLCLWDNIISCPPYFAIFIVVAYNILQREIILRLPDKETVVQFFHEQNPIDVCKMLSKAFGLMGKCPDALKPMRYMKEFQSIPKKVYPKFLNYPRAWVKKQEEEIALLQQEQSCIDKRIRELELEEYKMMERLENGLKEEEHIKRLNEMEKLYQETLKREEERIGCQRKMLLLYQKEIRSRKGEVIATLQESEQRKKALQMQKDLDTLVHSIERERLRNDTSMTLAEEEMRNQELELVAQKYNANSQSQPLAQKYFNDIQRLCEERKRLKDSLKEIAWRSPTDSGLLPQGRTNLDEIERMIDEIQKEFMCLMQNK